MSFKLDWQIPAQVLHMELSGHLDLAICQEIDRAVVKHLDALDGREGVALIIDAASVRSISQAFQQMRTSQSYSMRRELKYILITGTNKLTRLMMMLIFNLCKPALRFFDQPQQAYDFLKRTDSHTGKHLPA